MKVRGPELNVQVADKRKSMAWAIIVFLVIMAFFVAPTLRGEIVWFRPPEEPPPEEPLPEEPAPPEGGILYCPYCSEGHPIEEVIMCQCGAIGIQDSPTWIWIIGGKNDG